MNQILKINIRKSVKSVANMWHSLHLYINRVKTEQLQVDRILNQENLEIVLNPIKRI